MVDQWFFKFLYCMPPIIWLHYNHRHLQQHRPPLLLDFISNVIIRIICQSHNIQWGSTTTGTWIQFWNHINTHKERLTLEEAQVMVHVLMLHDTYSLRKTVVDNIIFSNLVFGR